MPGFVLNISSAIECSFKGVVKAATGVPQVLVLNQPVVTQSDTYQVLLCQESSPAPGPFKCLKATWQSAATKVTAKGQPILLMDSQGQGVQTAPHPLTVTQTQQKVSAR